MNEARSRLPTLLDRALIGVVLFLVLVLLGVQLAKADGEPDARVSVVVLR